MNKYHKLLAVITPKYSQAAFLIFCRILLFQNSKSNLIEKNKTQAAARGHTQCHKLENFSQNLLASVTATKVAHKDGRGKGFSMAEVWQEGGLYCLDKCISLDATWNKLISPS